MAAKPIRVLMIDDTKYVREVLPRVLSMDLSTEVVGVVGKPDEVPDAIRRFTPNILVLDITIQNIAYKEFIQKLRRDFPRIPIIVTSPLSSGVFEALKAGAVDFISKPSAQMQTDSAVFTKDLLTKIKTVYSGASFSHTPQPPPPVPKKMSAPVTETAAVASVPKPVASRPAVMSSLPMPLNPVFPNPEKRIIAIGASTGGTEAILAVVKNLPANTPGIVIVQHMPPVFTAMYADRLDKACKMSASEAQNGDRIRQGHILVAEGSQQMRVIKDARGYYVKVEKGEKVSGHCPSVDVMFDSVANAAGENAVGVILTGMGGDGAKNLLKMREAGAYTIGQDESTCIVYGMPMVAYNLGAVVDQLPLGEIPGAIIRYLTK